MSDKHRKKAAFGPPAAGRVYARDSAPMLEGRASTGSEARRARLRAKCHVCGGSGMGYPPYEAGCVVCNGKGVIELEGEIVERDHDERERARQNVIDAYAKGHQAGHKEAVNAALGWLRLWGHDRGADRLAERFNLTEGRDDDG
jgi:hypothetical protein